MCEMCLRVTATFITLRSIVLVEILGIQKLTNAFGLTVLFQGIAVLLGSPISGVLLVSSHSPISTVCQCTLRTAFCIPAIELYKSAYHCFSMLHGLQNISVITSLDFLNVIIIDRFLKFNTDQ